MARWTGGLLRHLGSSRHLNVSPRDLSINLCEEIHFKKVFQENYEWDLFEFVSLVFRNELSNVIKNTGGLSNNMLFSLATRTHPTAVLFACWLSKLLDQSPQSDRTKWSARTWLEKGAKFNIFESIGLQNLTKNDSETSKTDKRDIYWHLTYLSKHIHENIH